MAEVDPYGLFLKAAVTKWKAEVSLQGVINGPHLNSTPPEGGVVPYCVMSGSATLEQGSCKGRLWMIDLDWTVYHTTPALAMASLNTILAVFGQDDLTLTLDTGSLVSTIFRASRKVTEKPRTLESAQATVEYRIWTPRS